MNDFRLNRFLMYNNRQNGGKYRGFIFIAKKNPYKL